MTADAAKFSTARLSLDGVPERDRMGVYREVLGRHHMRMDVEPQPGNPLLIDLNFTALPGLRIVSGLVGPTRNRRTADLLDPGSDDFSMSLVEGGCRSTATRGREVITRPGEAQLMGPAETFEVTTTAPTRILRLQVPRAALAGVAGNLEDVAMRVIPRDSQPLLMLKGYLALLDDVGVISAPELHHTVVAHIHDLIVLTLGAHRDGAVLAGARGMAAAQLQAIKSDIVENIGLLDVTVEAVAGRHAVSVRRVQRLFEGEATTFTAFVLARRLARAHRMLQDPRLAHLGISAIAFDCGFGDLSHFNREFRRRFEATPSDVRAEARATWSRAVGA